MKKLKNRFICFGTPILCLLLLLGAVVLFSACSDTVSTEPEGESPSSDLGSAALPSEKESAGGQSDFEEAPALHFTLQNAVYFYNASIRDIGYFPDTPEDASDYFKTQEQGRQYLLVNALTSIDNYYDSIYGKQMQEYTELTILGKTHSVEATGMCGPAYAQNDGFADYSVPVYTYELTEYRYTEQDEAYFNYFEAELCAPDGRLRSVTLPAEEFFEGGISTKELTQEDGVRYAKELLSSLGYSASEYEVSIHRNEQRAEGVLWRITFTGKMLGNVVCGYVVEFIYDADSSYPDQVRFVVEQPCTEGLSSVNELIAQYDYEQKAQEDALVILTQDINNEDYIERLECVQIITRPRTDGTVSVMVYFFDKEATERKDLWDSPFDIAVQLIVEP